MKINQNKKERTAQKPGKAVIFLRYSILLVLAVYLAGCFRLSLKAGKNGMPDKRYAVYYVLNTDGMKGLGHSLLLLTDGKGRGTVLSFNGMQRSLGEALLGRAGIGRLSVGQMSADETREFLLTGNLRLLGDQLQDNYDWAVYRGLSQSEYDTVLKASRIYKETGDEYERLYACLMHAENEHQKAEYEEELEALERVSSNLLYRIYTNNCDTVARLLIASVDSEMEQYNKRIRRLTPNGNLKTFAHKAENWEVMELGDNSFSEELTGFLMIF